MCLLVSIHICVLIFLQRGLEGVYQKIASTFTWVEAMILYFMRRFYYSHSIVADGFGDIS